MLHTLSVSPWHADIAAMLRVMDHGDDLLLLYIQMNVWI